MKSADTKARGARITRRALLPLALVPMLVRQAAADKDSALNEPLQALYGSLEAAMRAGRSAPFAQRFNSIAPAVERAFDLDTILKVSVGLRWNSMDQATQAELSKTFRRFTVATYVANFDRYEGERFNVLPGPRPSGNDRVVRTEMVDNKGNVIRIDYVMREETGGWRAVDVLLDGSISRVAVQRSDFRTILANGDAPALIASLRRKIADLSEGALSS